jgi:hypothetical protein
MSYDRMYTFDLLTSLQIAMVKPHLNGFGFGKIFTGNHRYFSIKKGSGKARQASPLQGHGWKKHQSKKAHLSIGSSMVTWV